MSGDRFGDREVPNLRVKPPLVGMPLGCPLPPGTLFAAGCVATRAACNHRRVQQTLRPLTAGCGCTSGPPGH